MPTIGRNGDRTVRDLRGHVLAAAIRTAEAELAAHGYAEPERGLCVVNAWELAPGSTRLSVIWEPNFRGPDRNPAQGLYGGSL
jgi:hypothetical protein